MVRYFLWNGGDLVAEFDSSAAGLSKVGEYSYYPGLDHPHALAKGTTTYYAHDEVRGSVTVLSDGTATSKRDYAYDQWGALIGGSDLGGLSNADRARWKGALWMGPEDDIYYMRAR